MLFEKEKRCATKNCTAFFCICGKKNYSFVVSSEESFSFRNRVISSTTAKITESTAHTTRSPKFSLRFAKAKIAANAYKMIDAIVPPLVFLAAIATMPAASRKNPVNSPPAPLELSASEMASPMPAAQDWNPTTAEITMERMPRTSRRMTALFL